MEDRELTDMQEALLYGMRQFPLDLEDRAGIFQFLKTEEERLEMVLFLKSHLSATRDEIMKKFVDILQQRKQKQTGSSET